MPPGEWLARKNRPQTKEMLESGAASGVCHVVSCDCCSQPRRDIGVGIRVSLVHAPKPRCDPSRV